MSVGRAILSRMNATELGPAPLTLLVGAERLLLSRALAVVLRSAHALDASLERREVDASDPAALGELQTALSPSLFGDSAVVVVRGIDQATEGVVHALVIGLTDPAPGIWVVVEHSGTKAKPLLERLRKVLPTGTVEIACTEVKKGRATREFLEAQAKAADRRLTADGADALVLSVGSDIALLVGALEQLMSDHPTGSIDASVVMETFSGVAEVTGFQLADAVWEGRGLIALQKLRWGLTTQTVTGAGAVGSLAAGLRSMVLVDGAPRGMAEADVARLAGVPPFKVRQLRATARGWKPAQLADAVVGLAHVDAQVKGGVRPGENLEGSQKVHALESFIAGTTGMGGDDLRAPVQRPIPKLGRPT
jgi:DNA polymerase III subunit delta